MDNVIYIYASQGQIYRTQKQIQIQTTSKIKALRVKIRDETLTMFLVCIEKLSREGVSKNNINGICGPDIFYAQLAYFVVI